MQVKDIIEERTETYLRMLGIKIKSLGYGYLKTAIMLACENPELVKNITTQLYVLVAEQYNVNPKSVERNIRTTIDSAYREGDLLEINSIYGNVIYKNDFKLSNGELISLLMLKIGFDVKRYEFSQKYNIVFPTPEE